ncbi:NDR1/HIN1 protein [Trifolium repens]|nr:NDR1/HIN1 protein [Trifolium repens]
MESSPQPEIILQKPPGYRDPNATEQQTITIKPPHPPRKPHLPPSFRPKPRKRDRCRVCCCIFCIILFILIFIFVVAAALIYFIYQPSLPEFHIGSFRVPNFNVTGTPDVSYLDADTVTMVEVKNRNTKMVWHFEQSNVQIWAENGELNLGSTKVAAFDVSVRNMTALKAETNVRKEVLDAKQRRRLKSVFDSKALTPSVEVKTKTNVRVQGWNSMMVDVTVVCGDVTLRQIQNGDMPHCSFTIFKWIKI